MSNGRKSGVDFEAWVASFYVSKKDNAIKNGHTFELSLVSLRNILKANKCYYTGIPLTHAGAVGSNPSTNVTIDRIDNKKGYVKGNVVSCCQIANELKSTLFENPNYTLKINQTERLIKKTKNALKKTK